MFSIKNIICLVYVLVLGIPVAFFAVDTLVVWLWSLIVEIAIVPVSSDWDDQYNFLESTAKSTV